jgi:hypothetical protein
LPFCYQRALQSDHTLAHNTNTRGGTSAAAAFEYKVNLSRMKLISAEPEERRDTARTGRPFPQQKQSERERERESPDAFHPRQPRVITQEDELWIARKRKAIY